MGNTLSGETNKNEDTDNHHENGQNNNGNSDHNLVQYINSKFF